MQILQDCAHCGRRIKVDQFGRFLNHFPEKGKWQLGYCPGVKKTAAQTREENDTASDTDSSKNPA